MLILTTKTAGAFGLKLCVPRCGKILLRSAYGKGLLKFELDKFWSLTKICNEMKKRSSGYTQIYLTLIL